MAADIISVVAYTDVNADLPLRLKSAPKGERIGHPFVRQMLVVSVRWHNESLPHPMASQIATPSKGDCLKGVF